MGVTMFDFLSDKLGYHTKLYVILPWMLLQRYEIWIPILSVCDRGSSDGS